MLVSWWTAVPTIAIAVAAVTVPGVVVLLAGWGRRGASGMLLLAPAVSVAIVAVTAIVAPLLGIAWSLLPLTVATGVIAAAAWVVRRWGRPAEPAQPARGHALATLLALGIAVTVLSAQFLIAFVEPTAIAQRFDTIVHLNSVAYAVDTANASAFAIGATSDIGFYPNGWHAIASLASITVGSDIPTAVNVANLVTAAVVWPTSVLALTTVLFPGQRLALVAAGALSTGFGAFPALFFSWGPLFPNALGYAMIPAVIAAVGVLCRARGTGAVVRSSLLVLLVAGGCGLAHPNAFLAAFLLAGGYAVGVLTVEAIGARTRASTIRLAAVTVALTAVFLVLWPLVRTSAQHSGWAPWTDALRAVGKAVLGMPLGWRITPVLVLLVVVGLLAAARRLRWLPLLLPFAIATTLFVVASGLGQDNPVRQWLTNPWYNDSNRLAALLPIVLVPIATLGALTLVDAVRRLVTRRRAQRSTPPALRWLAYAAVTLTLSSVAVGTNATFSLGEVRAAQLDPVRLLTQDERALLQRLDDEVPADALIAGSPRTGTSLAYALAGRDVLRMHVFGTPSADEQFLNGHLRDIETEPQVCAAISRLGVDYVLDFGSVDVFGDDPGSQQAAAAFSGLYDLQPGPRLVLEDSAGSDARLFRIQGC